MNEDTDYTKWTVLREGDGGRHVHELQVALVQQGFWPGEDDMQWWQFGDATCSAVQTFQVSCRVTHSWYKAAVQVLCKCMSSWCQAAEALGIQSEVLALWLDLFFAR